MIFGEILSIKVSVTECLLDIEIETISSRDEFTVNVFKIHLVLGKIVISAETLCTKTDHIKFTSESKIAEYGLI